VPSDLIVVVLVRGKEASQGIVIGERFCPLCTCPWNITW
jgi:hypothetical protein